MNNLKERMNECAHFLTTIWGLEDRGLYAMLVVQSDPQDAEKSRWHDFPFKWPKGLPLMLRRILSSEKEQCNVYICPALFHTPERLRENVAGSNVLWSDSDGNAPASFEGLAVPLPSLQVRTSSPTNIHHYWLLDEFLDDIESLETGNRSITEYIDADKGCWDANRLLRPPGTTNRKNGLPVRLLPAA